MPDISLVYILEKGGRCHSAWCCNPQLSCKARGQQQASEEFQEPLQVPFHLLIFQKKLLMLFLDCLSTCHPHPRTPPPRFHTKGTKKEPHCGPGALPWLPVLAFPQKSPSIPKHVPQNHRARPPTTKLVVPHSRAPRTTGAQALVLAHMRTGPRPRPLATRGVPNDRRGRAGACRKATARAPRVGEVSPGREDAQPRVSLTPSAPHSRQAEAGLAPDRSAPAGGAPPPRPI